MRRHDVKRRRWLGFGTLGLVGAGLLSAGALAASGYSVHVKAPTSVTKGHKFTVTAKGSAADWAHLYIWLDRKACAATSSKEYKQDGTYKSGHSYFVQKAEGGTIKTTDYYAAVKGPFQKTPTAHAGTATGQEHACAYLISKDKFGNYAVEAAHASADYKVVK